MKVTLPFFAQPALIRALALGLTLGLALAAVGGCDSEPEVEDVGSVNFVDAAARLAKGVSTTLEVEVRGTSGARLDDAAVTLSSSDAAVIGITDEGKVSALSRGMATVTATAGGMSDTIQVGVVDLSGTWTATVADPAAPNGVNVLTYELSQNGRNVSGTYANLSGFPPLTDVNTGRVSGRLTVTLTKAEVEQTIKVSASPCNLVWESTMTLLAQGDGSLSLKPKTDRVPLTSDNCTLSGNIRIAEVRLVG